MNPAAMVLFTAMACATGATCAGCVAYVQGEWVRRARMRQSALEAQGAVGKDARRRGEGSERRSMAVRYAERLTRRLYTGASEPFLPSVRANRAESTRAGARYRDVAVAAGCSKTISASAYCEARMRMSVAMAFLGALFGIVFSLELAILLFVAGAVFGASLLPRAVRGMKRRRGVCAERHLSEMLEVVALGLRSGLTFDRSFALYGSHFDNEFACECARSYRKWSLGLSTRDEALRDLAASFDCPQLSRVMDSVLRGLRFGSSITDSLEEAAAQSRATYRTALEERVAKAPVKMMLPTGGLILPAMLLLVMGPVLLELMGGF